MASPQGVTDPTTNVAHLVSGVVYLDTELLVSPDNGAGPAYVPILRHELAHLVGLGHVNDPTQLMFPINYDQLNYQAGDLAGLAYLGRGACAPGL
ncbi:MAG: matrixin family metalloprotease [Cellulomonas sp.]